MTCLWECLDSSLWVISCDGYEFEDEEDMDRYIKCFRCGEPVEKKIVWPEGYEPHNPSLKADKLPECQHEAIIIAHGVMCKKCNKVL